MSIMAMVPAAEPAAPSAAVAASACAPDNASVLWVLLVWNLSVSSNSLGSAFLSLSLVCCT